MSEPTIEDQLALENRMIGYGVTRYRQNVQRAQEKDRGSESESAQRLLQEFVGPVADAVEDFLNLKAPGVRSKFKGLLKGVDSYKAAYIGLRAVMDFFTKDYSMVTLATMIGMHLEDEMKFSQFQLDHAEYYNTLIEDFKRKGTSSYRHMHRVLTMKAKEKDVGWIDWSPTERLQVGIKMIDLVMDSTNLIEKGRNSGKHSSRHKDATTIVPTEECLEWIRKFEHHAELLNPDRAPTIIPPDDWVHNEQGGYYSPQLRRRTPMVKVRGKKQRSIVEAHDLSNIQQALNNLQKTAWAVNSDILPVIKEAWAKSLPIGLPSSEPYHIPESPVAGTAKAELTEEQRLLLDEWKAEARMIHTMNKDRVSKCFQVVRVLRMATDYSAYDKFWYVYQCDFRGRVYASANGLSPQGSDFGKGLLRFAEGKVLGSRGAYWLQVHGANKYGNDKGTYDERVAWVKENEKFILAAADDPLSHSDFWGSADKPWQFLAFCFEYRKYKQEGDGMLSHLPIALDGSCNGLQNFSAMLRDEVGGKATNLIPSERPSDIYAEVGKVLRGKLLERKDEEYGSDWNRFMESEGNSIPRSLAKRPVMTLPYGSTQQSCREYIYKYMIEEKADFFPKETRFRMSLYLTPLLWESIAEVVIAARAAMDWIQAAAGQIAKTQRPILWVTPLGFPVYQDRRRSKSLLIETQLRGRMRIRMNEDSDKLDTMKQRLGASPNFIHSQDACHLHLTSIRASGTEITSLACIHDDYGTHAADTDTLHSVIRESFIELYENHDPLVQFKTMHEESYGITLPDLPPKGSLNIQDIRNSKYFFG